jgi:hypothetical protein
MDVNDNHYFTTELSSVNINSTFLSPRSFLLTATSQGGLIEIYEFKDAPETARAQLVTKLRLPPLVQGVTLQHFRVTTGPWLAYPSKGSSFEIDNYDRIYVFSLSFTNVADPSLCFVMHSRGLHKLGETHRAGVDRGRNEVSWEHWVPVYTRFLWLRDNMLWLRHVILSLERILSDIVLLAMYMGADL